MISAMADTQSSSALRETIARLAPGTALRDGLERILRGRTGALIVLGYDEEMEALCDGGFNLDVEFAPTRLRELSKMDGAVVLSTDGTRIVRANVQLVPDHKIPTVESGTRHRAAERTAIQTGYPVVSVSQSMSIVSVYVGGIRHVIDGSATILSRANQAVATLERYKARLDEVTRQLSVVEIEDFVTLRDALTVVQRLEMVRRVSIEIEQDVLELGTDGRQLALQLEELVGDNDIARQLIVRGLSCRSRTHRHRGDGQRPRRTRSRHRRRSTRSHDSCACSRLSGHDRSPRHSDDSSRISRADACTSIAVPSDPPVGRILRHSPVAGWPLRLPICSRSRASAGCGRVTSVRDFPGSRKRRSPDPSTSGPVRACPRSCDVERLRGASQCTELPDNRVSACAHRIALGVLRGRALGGRRRGRPGDLERGLLAGREIAYVGCGLWVAVDVGPHRVLPSML